MRAELRVFVSHQIFRHQRMAAEAQVLTPAFDPPYALEVEPALGLLRRLAPVPGQTPPLYLHHRAQQRATL